MMALKRSSLITFWEVSRSLGQKPWPEETLRLVCRVRKRLLHGTFPEVECGACSTFRCFPAPIRSRASLRCGFPSLVTLWGKVCLRRNRTSRFWSPVCRTRSWREQLHGLPRPSVPCWWCQGRAGVAAMPLLESHYSDKYFRFI